VDSQARRDVSAEILAAKISDLHIVALKLRQCFYYDLVTARDTGKCSTALFALANTWAIYIPSNTQAIEGLNNSIVMATKAAPAMLLPLLSSRIVGRALALPQSLGVGLPKFSVLAPLLEETLQAAVDFYNDGIICLDNVSRYRTPLPSQRQAVHRKVDPSSVPSAAQVWAARYNAKWATALGKQTNGWWLRGMLSLRLPGEDRPTVWACGLMYRYHGEMFACSVDVIPHDGGGGCVTVKLRRPFQATTSLELFANLYSLRQQRLPFSFAHGVWEQAPISQGEMLSAHQATLRDFESLGTLAPWASASSKTEAVLLRIEDVGDATGMEAEAAAIMCPPHQADALEEALDNDVPEGVVDPIEHEVQVQHAAGDEVLEESVAVNAGCGPSSPALVITDADRERMFGEWAREVLISIRALSWAATRPQELPGTNVSLLVYVSGDGSALIVNFVHWVIPWAKRKAKKRPKVARRVLLEDGKVKYSAPSDHLTINFDEQTYVCVVADTSVAMEKVRKPERPAMVPEAVRLKLMYECAVSSAAQAEADLGTTVVKPCLICKADGLDNLADTSCPLCLQGFHQRCLASVQHGLQDCLRFLVSKNQIVSAAPAGISLHEWFLQALCPFCREAVIVHPL